jgi:signal peptidase I
MTEEQTDGRPKRKRKRISTLRYVVGGVALLILGLIWASFASGRVGNYEVISNSMAPTLVKGDRVLVDQNPQYTPEVGDVVALGDPKGSLEMLTKRVAAVAEQVVEIQDGYLLVDGKKWAPPGMAAIRMPTERHMLRTEIRPGEVFVVGDESEVSEDSVEFGPVGAFSVKGRLWLLYWPPSHLGRVR